MSQVVVDYPERPEQRDHPVAKGYQELVEMLGLREQQVPAE